MPTLALLLYIMAVFSYENGSDSSYVLKNDPLSVLPSQPSAESYTTSARDTMTEPRFNGDIQLEDYVRAFVDHPRLSKYYHGMFFAGHMKDLPDQ